MSDAPTFASLLTQWSGGGPAGRLAVYAHLRDHPAEAAAVEASIRDELRNGWPWKRVIAAEAMLEVYRDEDAAASALGSVLREEYSPSASDALPLLQKLSAARAGPLLPEFALHAPTVFRAQPHTFHRWAGATAIRSGDAGAETWLALLAHAGAELETPLLMGLADVAREVECDLSAVEPAVRLRLFSDGAGLAAGAALWRLTWRVNRDWLASIDPRSQRLETAPWLHGLLIDVLIEHLGRRPDLAPLVRELLVRLGHEYVQFYSTVKHLAKLGARGWSVLLPILGDAGAEPRARAFVFREVARWPAVLTLAHHHAHAVILERTRDRDAVPPELLEAAAGLLRAIGAPAGSALPDVLDLIVKQIDTAKLLAAVIPALAPGYPNAAHAVARTLDRLRQSISFRSEAFAALAEVYAAMNLDSAPSLVEDTSFDARTLDLLLQEPAWNVAALEIRERHARALADRLAAPRPEVRSRAADLLRLYPDQMPAVWPALVALLAGSDEKAALRVLPYFKQLAPVADAVAEELVALFREPNPAYAARAVVALWRLERLATVADELHAAVVESPEDGRGWALLRGVVDRVFQSHGLLNELSRVFAAAPPEVAVKVEALLNPPESPDEATIGAHVKPENWPRVNFDGVYQCVCNDPEGGLLFLALMCAHGSAGFTAQKIWMIKQQRGLTRAGLAESKLIVERAIDRLTADATPGDRTACVRDFFLTSGPPPKALTDLLDHPLSWYRWAGLELLDAWGTPELVPGLIADRVWDRSALVRTRAIRMQQG